MAETQLPQPMTVRDMLSGLLGRDVGLQIRNSAVPPGQAYYAAYVDDQLRTAVVAVADLPFAAFAGAAIGLVPAPGAKDAVEEGKLTPMMIDNFDEILNVLSALFNTPGAPHLRLYGTYPPGEEPPADVEKHAKALGGRLDLDLDVPGYGKGALGLVLVF